VERPTGSPTADVRRGQIELSNGIANAVGKVIARSLSAKWAGKFSHDLSVCALTTYRKLHTPVQRRAQRKSFAEICLAKVLFGTRRFRTPFGSGASHAQTHDTKSNAARNVAHHALPPIRYISANSGSILGTYPSSELHVASSGRVNWFRC